MNTEFYKTLNDEELQEHYANCYATKAHAMGHNKTEWNRKRLSMILGEMKTRNIDPDGRQGQFNGNGSY